MDRHAYRRLSLAGAATGLVATGLLHPGNAWMLGPASLMGFLALFAAFTLGGTLLLAEGWAWMAPAVRFAHTSTAFVMVGSLAVGNLALLAALSWNNMVLVEQVAVVAFGAMGLAAGAREVRFGVRTKAHQVQRDAKLEGVGA